MIRQVWEDGRPRQLQPEDIEDADDTMIVMLARFMHQDVDVLERRPLAQLHRWYAKLIEILRSQSRKPEADE